MVVTALAALIGLSLLRAGFVLWQLAPVRLFHISGLIIGPGVTPSRCQAVASHIDLPPTLLSLMGVSVTHPTIGRDLTLPPRLDGGRAILQYANNHAYRLGDQVVVL